MTTKTIRKKVVDCVNRAEDNVLEAVYKMLLIYEDANNQSLMSNEQKVEIEKRARLYNLGKLKTSSWNEVKKRSGL